MIPEHFAARSGRALMHLGIVIVGLTTIVGSGGGGVSLGLPDTAPCVDTLQGCSPPPPAPPTAIVTPQRPIVQVGTPVQFSVGSDVKSPTYHWCWQPKGAATCTEIAGANGAGYVLAAASLADDGAQLQVTVQGGNGQAVGGALVAVSSLPAIDIADAEFAESDWNTVMVAVPPLPGSPFSATRVDSGGNPGAYRLLVVDLPLEVRTVNLLNSTAAAVYDPSAQGAVYRIEFSLDCKNVAVARSPTYIQYWLPALEQNGRRFIVESTAAASCFSPGWYARSWPGLDATYFRLVDGPACGSGETCPDFSGQGLPMRLGMAYSVDLRSPLPEAGAASAPHFEQGFDNFHAAVWRH